MSRRWERAIIAVWMLLPLTVQAHDETDRPTRIAPAVLDTFDAGAYQYQLAVEPCTRHDAAERCPIVVNLLKRGRRVDSTTLLLAAATPDFYRVPVDPAWGAALYDNNPRLAVWSAGFENAHVGTLARRVQLDDRQTGVLVTQNFGFERVSNVHSLYTELGSKIRRIWSYEPGMPFRQSAVYPVAAGGKPCLLFWKNERIDDVLTAHHAYLLRWDAHRKAMESIALPSPGIPLFAVAIAFYATPPESAPGPIACRRNNQSHSTADEPSSGLMDEAYVHPYILSTKDYPGLPQGKAAMLGNMFFTLAEAQQYRQRLKNCAPSVDAGIIELAP